MRRKYNDKDTAQTTAPNDKRVIIEHARIRSRRSLWSIGVALLVVLGILLIPFFRDTETTTTDTGATVGDIARTPTEFFGRAVTVSGEVKEMINPRVVVLGGDKFIGADELLIICVKPMPVVTGRRPDMPVEANDILQVVGVVHRFELAKIEEDTGIDLDDTIFRRWSGQPVLLARAYHITPRAPAVGVSLVDMRE